MPTYGLQSRAIMVQMDMVKNDQGNNTIKNLHKFARSQFRWLVFWFLLISPDDVVQGQTISKNLPSVYLSFKAYFTDNEGNEMVRLTLRNNTRWPIILTRPVV